MRENETPIRRTFFSHPNSRRSARLNSRPNCDASRLTPPASGACARAQGFFLVFACRFLTSDAPTAWPVAIARETFCCTTRAPAASCAAGSSTPTPSALCWFVRPIRDDDESESDCRRAQVSRDGARVVSCSLDGFVRVNDVASGSQLFSHERKMKIVCSVCVVCVGFGALCHFAPADEANQAMLAAASDDASLLVSDGAGNINVFSLQSGLLSRSLATHHAGAIKSVAATTAPVTTTTTTLNCAAAVQFDWRHARRALRGDGRRRRRREDLDRQSMKAHRCARMLLLRLRFIFASALLHRRSPVRIPVAVGRRVAARQQQTRVDEPPDADAAQRQQLGGADASIAAATRDR